MTIAFCNRANKKALVSCMLLWGHEGLHVGADPDYPIDSSRTITWESQSLDDGRRCDMEYDENGAH